MQRSPYFLLLGLLVTLLLVGCRDKQIRFSHRMEGTWEITREVITLIKPDGSTETTVDRENAGVLELNDDNDDKFFLNYNLTVDGSNYSWVNLPFQCDEERKRVLFYYFYCDDIFGCDMIATIEEDKPRRQQWSFFRQSGSEPGGTVHRKVTWVLEKM
ncbi:MAG: hypothetical protein KDC54_15100 [Lewinella sp.]|nr:hypothetical protein [Lewinella sp.]